MYQSRYLGWWSTWNSDKAQSGYSQKNIGGDVRPASQKPTLIVTEISDFSYLFMTITADTVFLNIIYEGILLMVLSTMMKEFLLQKSARLKTRLQKQ